MPTEFGHGAARGDVASRTPNDRPDQTSTVNDGRLVGEWIGARSAVDPEHVAIVFHGRTMTYRELDHRSTRLALALLARGLEPGARVASITENHPEHVVLLFACAKAGLILAPLNWRLAHDELQLQVELFDPSLIVVSATQWPRVTANPAIASHVTMHLESLNDELVTLGTTGDLPSVDEQDGLLLIATSGTTGTPKGALLTHANCYWTNRSLDAAVPMTGDDVVLQVLPQYHVGGWNVQPLLAWWRGATVVLESSFDAPHVLEVIQHHGVTTMMGCPPPTSCWPSTPRSTTPISRACTRSSSGAPRCRAPWSTGGASEAWPWSRGTGSPRPRRMSAACCPRMPRAVPGPWAGRTDTSRSTSAT